MKTYHGTLARVSAGRERISDLRWHDAPPKAFLYGFVWTACSDITARQFEILGQCALLTVTMPDGKNFLCIPLAKVPYDGGWTPQPFLVSSPERKAVLLEGDWSADKWRWALSFHDDPGDPESGRAGTVWKTFPGETHVRVDMVDLTP